MWMCNWFCERETAELTARLIQSRGNTPPALAR